jgi:hypothetical protein
LAKRAGKRIEDQNLGLFGAPAKEDVVKQLMDAGFGHLIFGLPPAKSDKVLPLLDRYAEIARKSN